MLHTYLFACTFLLKAVASAVVKIKVGVPSHQFGPDIVNASIGDSVEFSFMNSAHSVVRAEYQAPCTPYESLNTNKQGFSSGLVDTSKIGNNQLVTWNILVNDTEPIFFYCSAPNSCDVYQMVGVINPGNTDFQHHKDLAKGAHVSQPGAVIPPESGATTAAPAPSPSSPAPKSSHFHLSTPAIIGISVGAAAVVILAAALFFFIGRSKSLKESTNRQSATVRRAPPQDVYDPPPQKHVPMNLMVPEPPSFHPNPVFSKPEYSQPPEYYPHRVEEGAHVRSSTMSPVSSFSSPAEGGFSSAPHTLGFGIASPVQELDGASHNHLVTK